MVAWCRNGTSYTASTRLAAPASAAAASPSLRASTPGCSARLRNSARIPSESRRRGALIPLDLEGFSSGHRLPVRVGDDRDTGGAARRPRAGGPRPGARLEGDDGAYSRHGLGLGGVVRLERAAEHRTALDRGDEHARRLHIDAEHRAAGDFGGGVEPRHAGAE